MIVLLLLLAACDESTETTYTQYNGEDDSVVIQVGADTEYTMDDLGNEVVVDASTTLSSTSGEYQLGIGSVSPASGPIGTVHTVRVELDEDYDSDVDRVSIRTSSGDRGEDEYDLDEDSAGEGLWTLELTSYGEEGEVREDTLTFRLWQADETSSTGDDSGDGFSIF